MRTIWKQKIQWAGDTLVSMEPNATILSVQLQDGKVTLWYEHDYEADRVLRVFKILPTGYEFRPFDGKYLGTVQDSGDVWHVYEVYE